MRAGRVLVLRGVDSTDREETYHAVGQLPVHVGVAAAQVFHGRVAGVLGTLLDGINGGTFGSASKSRIIVLFSLKMPR